MARTATVGPEIYRRVNELVAEGKRRGEALTQVAEERGQRVGAVSANYYRVARAEGATGTRPRRGPGTRRAARRTSRTAGGTRKHAAIADVAGSADGEITTLASQISTLTRELVRAIEERDAKLRALIG